MDKNMSGNEWLDYFNVIDKPSMSRAEWYDYFKSTYSTEFIKNSSWYYLTKIVFIREGNIPNARLILKWMLDVRN